MNLWSIIGLLVVLLITLRFINELGRSLPVLELLLLIAGLQWIIGPVNSYGSSVQHFKYYMYVDEASYMSYVVPAFISFTLIILFGKKKLFNLKEIDLELFSKFGIPIMTIGIIADIAAQFAPSSLAFFLFLLAQFKFVGAGILVFSSSKKERILFYLAILYLFLDALNSAMFHDLLLWGAFLFMLWAIKHKPDLKKKIVIILGASLLITGIQVIKSSYRQQVWGGFDGNKLDLLLEVIGQELNNTDFADEAAQEELNVRLNQGWIISAIIKNTPENVDYGKGETISEAVTASLLPRFLFPDKAEADGRANFIKYTGIDLKAGTSMGLSIVGEAYANFGGMGGIVFMLVYGCFLVLFWNKLLEVVQEHPILLFFIPLIFLQVIKAESQMLSVLNHLTKSTIVVLLFYNFFKKVLGWKI